MWRIIRVIRRQHFFADDLTPEVGSLPVARALPIP